MKRIAFVLALLVAAGAAVAWVMSAPKPRYSEAEWQALGLAGDPVAGRLVFFAGGCESCHKSPGQDDPLRLGGGLELKTPFGSFYPPNISSDQVDGIGGWRPVDVANALLAGVSRDGKNLYPSFPYPSYQRMTPKDVADLIAFLRTLPAVAGKAPPNDLAFPFSIRRASACGSSSISTTPAFTPTRRKANNGIVAATSSKALAIAANVTPRAAFWARRTRAGRSLARLCPTVTARRRTCAAATS